MPDDIELLVAFVFAETAFVALSVAVPQAVLLVRLWRAGESIARYTLKTVAWTGTIGLILFWRSLLFVDYTLFEQRYFGTIEERWPVDLTLALLFAVAVNYAATLYHWDITFGHATRGTTLPNLLGRLDASTEAGRSIAHAVADDLQMPVATLDAFARDARLPDDVRSMSAKALAALDQVMARVRQQHREIRRLGGLS